ncbi:AAA family ATPase [Thioalkalivibrio sp. HK1]|uniref:AAA family ATPase n=1 Tax=Thioalkalivibrio sp. HK1 TaxID=1469245 RepID=UPI0004703542|nr:ATP-binding protein [Thioalkalivibrio sp. HK1]
MASANQLKAFLKSHLEGDEDRFLSVAMQVAAHEAKRGHGKLAQELRALIDQAKARRGLPPYEGGEGAFSSRRSRDDPIGVLAVSRPKSRLAEMVLDDILASGLNRVIKEQRQASKILSHGLSPRRKLLLVGAPGTGKTMTASVLAGELGLPLLRVRLDGLITKYMGETAAKLRQVFDTTERTRGVYFFDEFDAIGSQRGLVNDIGEVRRILNSFLQMIEQDDSHSLILAATNHPDILDHALFRRFDDVLHYSLPDETRIASILESRLGRMSTKGISWKRLATESIGLSYAEVTCATKEALKEALIEDRGSLTESDIRRTLEERQRISRRFESHSRGTRG